VSEDFTSRGTSNRKIDNLTVSFVYFYYYIMSKLYFDIKDKNTFIGNLFNNNISNYTEYYIRDNTAIFLDSLTFYKKTKCRNDLLLLLPKDIVNIIIEYVDDIYLIKYSISKRIFHNTSNTIFIQINFDSIQINNNLIQLKIQLWLYLTVNKLNIRAFHYDLSNNNNKNNIIECSESFSNPIYVSVLSFFNMYMKMMYNTDTYFSCDGYYTHESLKKNIYKYINDVDEYNNIKKSITIMNHKVLKYIIIILKLVITSIEKHIKKIYNNNYETVFNYLKQKN
jgi:hypothetical protein